jgi:hypothetical protein
MIAAPFIGGTRAATVKAAQDAATRNLVSRASRGLPAAERGVAPGQSFVSGIRQAALTDPGFARTELASLGAAATAGGVAAGLEPESEVKPLIAEMVAGSIHPIAWASRLAGSGASLFKQGVQSLSQEGRERAAAEMVRQRLAEFGESPAAVEEALSGFTNTFRETSGQATGSPVLLAIERALLRDPTAARELKDQYAQSKALMEETIDALKRQGSPSSLRAAAELRLEQFDQQVLARIAQAEKRAQSAGESLVARDGVADPDVRARELLEGALSDARKSERQLWEQVDQSAPLTAEATVSAMRQIKDETLPEFFKGSVPAPIRTFVRRAKRAMTKPDAKPITTGEVLSFRSELLDQQRQARAAGDFQRARRIGMLADSALEDLGSAGGDAASTARAFSRVLNERFTQGSVGRTLRLERSGASAVPEEMTLQSTVGAGGTRGALRAREQREAVTPIRVEGFSQARNQRLEELVDTQSQFIREMIDKTRTPEGEISPGALARWRRANADLLSDFPELDNLTASAEQVKRFSDRAISRLEGRRKAAERGAFASLVGTDSPATVFTRAMGGPDVAPEVATKRVRDIFRVVRSADDAAKAGAKSAFMESLLSQTQRKDGLIDGAALREMLNKYGDDAIAAGAMTREERARLNKMAQAAERVMRAERDPRELGKLVDNPSAFEDLIASFGGAKLGQAIAGQGMGSSLVMAGRMAQMARNKLKEAPVQTMSQIMLEAAQNPDYMVTLLRKPTTQREAARLSKQVEAFMLASGLAFDEEKALEE